ncbi:MAG: hypothetical protein ACKO42_00775 [Gammaproteobacteria bacterium]
MHGTDFFERRQQFLQGDHRGLLGLATFALIRDRLLEIEQNFIAIGVVRKRCGRLGEIRLEARVGIFLDGVGVTVEARMNVVAWGSP